MSRWPAVVGCLAIAACGRLDFDPLPVPLVWLPLDDPPGSTTLHDASGHGHDATCLAATCPTLGVPGVRGTAAAFDGVDDFAEIAYASDLDVDTITVSAWVKLAAQSVAGYAQIASRQYGTGIQDVWVFGYDDPNKDATCPYQLGIRTDAGAPATPVYGGPSAPDLGIWVHIVGTYDGQVARLYRNCVEVGAKQVGGPMVPDTTGLVIGAGDNGSPLITEYIDATIADLRIYAGAVAPEDTP